MYLPRQSHMGSHPVLTASECLLLWIGHGSLESNGPHYTMCARWCSQCGGNVVQIVPYNRAYTCLCNWFGARMVDGWVRSATREPATIASKEWWVIRLGTALITESSVSSHHSAAANTDCERDMWYRLCDNLQYSRVLPQPHRAYRSVCTIPDIAKAIQ